MELGRISRRTSSIGGAQVGRSTVGGWRDVIVSAKDMANLEDSPVVLVPDPGAGTAIEFTHAILVGKADEDGEPIGGSVTIRYTDADGPELSEEIDLGQLAGEEGPAAVNVQAKTMTPLKQNAAVVLCGSGGGDEDSTSKMLVRTFYRTHGLGSDWGEF